MNNKKRKTIEYICKLNFDLQAYYLELLIKKDKDFLIELNIYIQGRGEEKIFHNVDFELEKLNERDIFFNTLSENDYLFITYKKNTLFLNISRFSKEILTELLKNVFFITPKYFRDEKSAFKNINITNTKKRDTKVYIKALNFLHPELIQQPSLYIKKVIKLIDKSSSLYKKALKVFEEDKVLISDVIYYDKDGGYHTYSKKDVKLEYLNYILNKCSKYNNIKYDIKKLFEYKILIPLYYNIKSDYSFIYPKEDIYDYGNGLKEIISKTKVTTFRQIVLDNIVIFKNITQNDLKEDGILLGVTKKKFYIPDKENRAVCHFSNFYWDIYIGKESNKLYYCYVVPIFKRVNMKIITKVTEINKINKNEYKGYFRNKNEPFFIKINRESIFFKSNRGDIKLHCSIKDIENYDESFLFDNFADNAYKKIVFNKTAALNFIYKNATEYLLEDEDFFLKTELEEDTFIEKIKSIKGISSLKKFLNGYNLDEEETIIKAIENSCLFGYENFSKVIKDINLFCLNESFNKIDKNILFKYDSKNLNKITILKEIIKGIRDEKVCCFSNKKRFG